MQNSENIILYLFCFALVTGRQFEVKEIFLEDILKLTSFNPPALQKHKDEKMRSWETLSYLSIKSNLPNR